MITSSYGGAYVAELLVDPLEALRQGFARLQHDATFNTELMALLTGYAGRPTPLTLAPTLSEFLNRPVYLKREDLLHGGAHKTNNALGQGLLARTLGKTQILAETGAGQHGVAVAMAAARLGLTATIFMGQKDIERQQPNVQRMKLFGAEVVAVTSGSGTLRDACSEALRHWAACADEAHYLLGSVTGPDPYPTMVRHFQTVIGTEARQQIVDQTGDLPDDIVACVGGGSNAMGLFTPFLKDDCRLWAAEPGGRSLTMGQHGASLSFGKTGILHGARTRVLLDDLGHVAPAHSIAAGLDYPAVGPELANLVDLERVQPVTVGDQEALGACRRLCLGEGILPALESSHALAALELINLSDRTGPVIVGLSGRGDKDLKTLETSYESSIADV